MRGPLEGMMPTQTANSGEGLYLINSLKMSRVKPIWSLYKNVYSHINGLTTGFHRIKEKAVDGQQLFVRHMKKR